jgi:hypothetical protein
VFLGDWAEKTGKTRDIAWAGTERRQTRFFIGGLLGDQQVMYWYIAYFSIFLIIFDYF